MQNNWGGQCVLNEDRELASHSRLGSQSWQPVILRRVVRDVKDGREEASEGEGRIARRKAEGKEAAGSWP